MKNLIYTIAFDPPGQAHHQLMAKFLVSSIFRTNFSGDVLVLTNSEYRLFEHRRDRLTEICLDTKRVDPHKLGLEAQKFKYNAREFFRRRRYEKIMFVDCDCIFTQSADAVFFGEEDIGYTEEAFASLSYNYYNAYLTTKELKKYAKRFGINSGTLWVRSEHYDDTMQEWCRIDSSPVLREKICGDQPAWVRLLLDTDLKTRVCLRKGQVRYPFIEGLTGLDIEHANLLHFNAATPHQKLRHLLGHYMRRFQASAAYSIASLLDG